MDEIHPPGIALGIFIHCICKSFYINNLHIKW